MRSALGVSRPNPDNVNHRASVGGSWRFYSYGLAEPHLPPLPFLPIPERRLRADHIGIQLTTTLVSSA